jgi:hypothetical protein
MSEVMTYAAFLFAISIIQDHASKVDLFVLACILQTRHVTTTLLIHAYLFIHDTAGNHRQT